MSAAASESATELRPPKEDLWRLFLRFLRFGCLAWGGPVAQIAMIRQELVEEERWVTPEHFKRVLAVYQILPGPEAHEMCVYFGYLARGRIGGTLAGLGFMLPGFILMFLLSWAYFRYGLAIGGAWSVVFATMQAAVAALVVRAVHRIGGHVLSDRWLWAIAGSAGLAQLAGLHFAITLGIAGVCYVLARKGQRAVAALAIAALAVTAAVLAMRNGLSLGGLTGAVDAKAAAANPQSLLDLFVAGLKAGLLTFGGAYTVIPFLQEDAVESGGWMSTAQFMDGLALSSLLPAPLIIFATFVGYAGGGPAGAVVLTIGIFLPAFAFTLLGHEPLERILGNAAIREFLEGVTAGVVGLIAATAVVLVVAGVKSVATGIIFALALIALFRSKSKLVIPAVVATAAAAGFLLKVLA
jgi:chromate transporter